MSALNKYIGKIVHTKSLGRVKVISRVPKTITKLVVKILEKGKEQRIKYINQNGDTISGWARGLNREYGQEDEIHVNDIISISSKS